MATSKELAFLRGTPHRLHTLYAQHLSPKHHQSTNDLKAARRGYALSGDHALKAMIDKELLNRAKAFEQERQSLIAEAQAARAAIAQRAVRKRPAVDAATKLEMKAELRSILDSPHSTSVSAPKWIREHHADEPAYWSCLEDLLSTKLAAASIGPMASKTRQMCDEIRDVAKGYEAQTLNPQEQAAALEAREVDACMGFLAQGLREAETYSEKEQILLTGVIPQKIMRWPGIPEPGRENGLLQPGQTHLEIIDRQGQFISPDQQPQKQET